LEWLEEDVVLAIHEALIAEHGGPVGIRDQGLLLSALARPKNAALYAKPDVPELAALYAISIIRNHPFVDGNKRVGAVLLEMFLSLHGLELQVSDSEFVATILEVTEGSLSEDRFIQWVRRNVAPQR
jgi:death on curing protein